MTRRSLWTGFLGGGVVFFQGGVNPVSGQTQVNANKQIKNLVQSAGGDNWLSVVPAGVINSANTIFTLPATVKKIMVFLMA